MKVLIDDDSNAMRMIVRRTLREAGFGRIAQMPTDLPEQIRVVVAQARGGER